MNNDKYQLELFGQVFNFVTNDGKKEELLKIGSYFKNVVESLLKKMPNKSQLEIVVLAGLMITDELYTVAKSKKISLQKDREEVDEIISEAIKQLDISLNL